MAAKQFIGGTGLGEWNTNANWAGGAFATNLDTVTFAVTGNPLKVNVASACISIDFTGFTGTTNMAATLTVAGNVTLVAGMGVISGASALVISAASTITSNAKTWTAPLTLSASTTYTLADNLSVTGELKFSNNNPIINGFTWNVGGNLNLSASPVTVTGTSGILMNGTGTLISASASSGIQLQSFVINTAGTITLPTANFIAFGAHATLTTVWTYTAGTIVAGAVKFGSRSGVSFTVTAGTNCRFTNLGLGVTNPGASGTITLGADLYSSGTVSGVGATQTMTLNGFKLYVATMSWITANTSIWTGTTDIEFNGSGSNTWDFYATTTHKHNVIFNMAGSLVVNSGATSYYNTGTITYTAGTVSHTGTMTISASTTFNTNGMTWNNMTFSGSPTITLNSLLTSTGTFTTSSSITFAGTAGWTVNSWTCITAGVTVTFANGVTYTLSGGSMTNTGTAASKILFTSDHAVTKAILTLVGVTEANVYLSGTRMDSSLGGTVWTVGGVLTTTINWNLLTAPATVSSGFVN